MNLDKITNACVKCGKCVPVCTIHDINADETTSPRGFLDLIAAYKGGKLTLDKNLKTIFESCFLCTNCVEACPSSIRVDSAIEAVRFDMTQKFKIAWYKRVAFFLLSKRPILDLLARVGFVFQSCAFKINDDFELNLAFNFQNENQLFKIDEKSKNLNTQNLDKISKFKVQNSGMKARFSLPLVRKGRLLPSLAKKSFLNSNPAFIDNGGTRTIGLFVGCLANYAYTSTAEAVLIIAKALKINVDLMQNQRCCGAPQYFTGAFKSVENLAKFNIAYFEKKLEKLEAIIVPEATCSAMLNVDYEHFFALKNDEIWKNRAKNVAKKIFLATKFFNDFTNLGEILAKKGKNTVKITYHDPCHARKMQGVFKEPRTLLSQNFTLVELAENNKCCGFGGVSTQLDHYDKALKVGLKKAEQIHASGAKIVSAECSACRMQISNALNVFENFTNLGCENLTNLNSTNLTHYGNFSLENPTNLKSENLKNLRQKEIIFKNPLELIAENLK